MPHTHPNCDLAGVFWIKCPKDCGDIVFENPCNFQTHNEVDSYTEELLTIISTQAVPPVILIESASNVLIASPMSHRFQRSRSRHWLQ